MYIKFKIVVYRAKIQKNAQNTKNLQYLLIRYATLRNAQRKKLRVFLCHSIRLQYLCPIKT